MARTVVPFADLSFQWRAIASHVMGEMPLLFENSAFCLGPAVERFEEAFSSYLGVQHAVGVNSGTSALHLAAVVAGLGPGDKVLIPANTFIATAWAVIYVGATPVLCDADPSTGTIDVTDAERRIDDRVKAIIPVHLYGQPANMHAVMKLATRHGLTVIEDAAQAHGARFGGVRVGTIGRLGCFSFYPAKNLGAAGEAGIVVTADEALAARLRSLRQHAQRERYLHDEVGFNYRMEGIQGLVLVHKLRHLDEWTETRRQIARRYLEALARFPLGLPEAVNGDHVYHLFVVRTPRRDALRAHLDRLGIQTGLHYPVPLNRQPCLARFNHDRDGFPVADHYATEGLSLPIFVGMTEAQVDAVIAAIATFFDRSARRFSTSRSAEADERRSVFGQARSDE